MDEKNILFNSCSIGFLIGALSSLIGKPKFGPILASISSCLFMIRNVSSENAFKFCLPLVFGYMSALFGAKLELFIENK